MKVRHIIVCGHYGCGGVRAAMDRQEFGLIDNWLRKIKDVYSANKDAVDSETDPEKRLNLLDAGNLVLVVTTKAHHALFHHPMPLPDDLVIEFIDATAAALSTLETLNRHDLLGFVEVLVMAKDAPNVCPLPHRYRDPESDYEARLCNAAERAQDRLAEQLNGFVRRFTALRNDVLRAGMAPVVRTLSVQGAVADTLHLTPAGSSHCQELALPAKFARIFRHLRHALTADTALVSRLADAARRQSLEPMDIQVFHAYADPHRAARFAPGRYRTHDIDWSSEYPSDVPAAEVPAAHDAFYAAFDQALLTRWHPVIRAGLGLYECLRISAHVEERRRIADLVCTMLMDEMGLALAPIMLARHRRRHGLDNLLDGTLRMGSPDLLLDHMVIVAEAAIAAGRLMLERLQPERQRMFAALVAAGFEIEPAESMVLELLSNVIVRVPQPSDVVPRDSRRTDRMGEHLHTLGMIDRVDFDSRDWWSSAVVRKVASSWP